jgi:type IV secretion system protein VirB8
MKQDDSKAREAYYRAAQGWANDREASLAASRRIGWIVAAVAAVIALVEGVALAMLMPLKTVVPYTLLVDRQTGYVQALKPLEANMIAPDAALTQSFLVQYVIAREGYDITTVQNDYRKVALFSEGGAKSDYLAAMQATNPASPLNRLPRSTTIETRVKSVSPLRTNTALVRFDTIRHDATGAATPAQPWVAVISYRYTGEPASFADRTVNPLGFAVTRYRRDPEALVAEPPAASPVPPASVQP